MLKKFFLVAATLALVVPGALGDTASKEGTPIEPNPGSANVPSNVRADFEYNTGGYIDFVPTTGGSASGWGEWFITTVLNDTGHDLLLVEFGFPCCGPPTEPYGWLVWTDVGGIVPPPGNAYTADYWGAFTPVDPGPGTFPPTVYTYIDVSGEGIVIPNGAYLCFGYDVTDIGGQTTFNGVTTWAWYSGMWDPDPPWGRTAILQVKANYTTTPTADGTWGTIKALFR
ncbi:MAG: hypothetical protein KAY24_12120 [Candidatus Eisenbacteria sp.]|nr:hypothetical protein [Candidatus Eisenbacteria bacterium]